MAGTFHVAVVTPEREVLALEAKFVAFPAYDGEMGILAAARAAARPARRRDCCASTRRPAASVDLFIAGGFAQMVDDKLTLLTEEALEPEKVNAELAKRALAEAGKLPNRTEAESDRRAKAEARARVIAHLAKG